MEEEFNPNYIVIGGIVIGVIVLFGVIVLEICRMTVGGIL